LNTLLLAAGDAHGQLMLRTMVTAIAGGVFLIVLARRLGVPSIVALLAGGVLLGPEVWGEAAPIQPASLGHGLGVTVALAVGLILFEGGLTLDMRGYRLAPKVIRRLLTTGVMITWFGTAACLNLVGGLDMLASITSASLVIVTGPTVVVPLVKRLGVNEKLASILRWEAILIDPIGVLLAVLCFESLVAVDGGQVALLNLVIRVVAGLVIGGLAGLLVTLALRVEAVPEDMLNMFVLACAVLCFGLAEAVLPETGLLAVTVAGFLLGLSQTVEISSVRAFKEELTSLLIGLVFMLLAARLDLAQVQNFGWSGALTVALVIFLVRPLSVAACTARTALDWRERGLLSWVAPRGVVAASMASLVAITLEEQGATQNARYLETFTWSVIVGTIVLQGLTAGYLVDALGLKRERPRGWAIVGAHPLAIELARFLSGPGAEQVGVPVVLIDTNAKAVKAAREVGLTAMVADARDPSLLEHPDLVSVGNLLALTDNEDLNVLVCGAWADELGREHTFRWAARGRSGQEGLAGRPALRGLPRPSRVALELARGESRFEEIETGQSWSRDALPVLSATPEAVFLGKAPQGKSGRTLILHRRSQLLRGALHRELVMTRTVSDREALFRGALMHIAALLPALDVEAGMADLMERHAARPGLVEKGLALAHIHSAAAPEPTLAVILLPEGVDFDVHDEPPVTLLFLLVSPLEDPDAHLGILADIAHLVASEARREALLAAETEDALFSFLYGEVSEVVAV
jgi:NhaP-type Na+/H+ or K+/H+ antiporter/mannitol/fructose-specific phosphotransferase system IIA component (Ntr-type)